MDAQIRVAGSNEIAAAASLWEWLRGERQLAGRVRLVPQAPREGDLGGAFDVLTVALGSGGAGVVLARSLVAWLQTRRPEVTVTLETEAGTVKVSARNLKPADALPLIEQVLKHGDA
ncbi:MAG TPA: hypothetical protein VIU15_26820 [Streptomyces sp.]